MKFNMERIIKDSRGSSSRLSALPFVEEFRLLDALRERTLTIIASRQESKRDISPFPKDLS